MNIEHDPDCAGCGNPVNTVPCYYDGYGWWHPNCNAEKYGNKAKG